MPTYKDQIQAQKAKLAAARAAGKSGNRIARNLAATQQQQAAYRAGQGPAYGAPSVPPGEGAPTPVPEVPGAEPTPEPQSYTNKEVKGVARDYSGNALDLALKRLAEGGFDEAFNPELTARAGTGDLATDRARIEEEVYGRLTRDTDQQYNQALEAKRQQLAEQGIQYDENPNSRYQKELKDVNNRFDTLRTDARQRAAEIGGTEYQRNFNISEARRAGEFGEQAGIRNQNLGEIGGFAGQGMEGLGQLFGIKDANRQRALQKFIAELQASTSRANTNASIAASDRRAAAANQPTEDDVFVGGM